MTHAAPSRHLARAHGRALAIALLVVVCAACGSAKPAPPAGGRDAAPSAATLIDAAAALPAPIIDASDADAAPAADAGTGADARPCKPPGVCSSACPRHHSHQLKMIDGCQVAVCCAPDA